MDYKNPDYTQILRVRAERLKTMRAKPELMAAALQHYKNNPWDFINDWGMTFDPRNLEVRLPAVIPFILFPRQVDYLKWVHESWLNGEKVLVEKTRDIGVSWLSIGYAVTMFLFWPGYTAGFGSRKEELVDKKGDPKCLFEKARFFLKYLPADFMPGAWDEGRNMAYMRITNPDNDATITGEAGDNIGRGGRTSIYFVDEAAHIPRQASVDAALANNTNCQVDMSSVNGSGNAFYEKRHSGRVPVFVFDWRDDPRKGEDWYKDFCAKHTPEIVAQEVDRDYHAAREGVFIPAKWVRAAKDAHLKLGFEAEGMIRTGFDPADVGDAKGHICMHGSVVTEAIEQKIGDIREAVTFAKEFADDNRAEKLIYDADGMGASAIKLSLAQSIGTRTKLVAFYGGGAVESPDKVSDNERTNKERYKNLRAQRYSNLRKRFENTYNAVENGVYTDPATMISISSKCKNYFQLESELSRPERKYDGEGKIKVESKVDMRARGVASPNLSDGLMMCADVPDDSRPDFSLDYSMLRRATAGSPMRRSMR